MSNTFKIEPYSYIINLTSNEVSILPSGSIHFEIKLSDSSSSINHNWYGEIKYTSPNTYFSLYSTTNEISDESSASILYIYIDNNTIKLRNNSLTSKYFQVTVLS